VFVSESESVFIFFCCVVRSPSGPQQLLFEVKRGVSKRIFDLIGTFCLGRCREFVDPLVEKLDHSVSQVVPEALHGNEYRQTDAKICNLKCSEHDLNHVLAIPFGAEEYFGTIIHPLPCFIFNMHNFRDLFGLHLVFRLPARPIVRALDQLSLTIP
jgi:hypothetical protein